MQNRTHPGDRRTVQIVQAANHSRPHPLQHHPMPY
jgi:hypothetical protein